MIRGYNGKMLEYIGEVAVVPGKTGTLEIPADRLWKSFHFCMGGDFAVTYSAGTVKINHNGVMNGIIRKLVLQNRGGEDLRTYLGVSDLINDQKLDFVDRGALLYKGNSLTLGDATSSDGYVVAATTQNNSFYEAIPMYMENRKSLEYYKTYYSTMGNKSAKFNFDFNNWSAIIDPEDTSTITNLTGNAVIEVYGYKADHLIAPYESYDQHLVSYDQIAPVGNTNATRFTISPEGELQGFWIRAVKGANDIRFTYEDMKNTVMEFKFDGETIWKGNLLAGAAINMHDRPLLDVIRGCVRIDQLNSKTYKTGLFTGEGSNAKSIEVFITCNVANPKFIFVYDRIREARQPEVAKA